MEKKIKKQKPADRPTTMTGKELVGMGFRIDSNGFLIGNTFTYDITYGVPWGIIRKS